MKAAFLFSGQLRGFSHCIESLNQFLFSAFNEYDTFFCVPNNDGEELLKYITPTSVLLEADQNHPEISGFENSIGYSLDRMQKNGYECRGRMQHYYLQWYGVKRVFEVFDSYRNINNKHYDVIFRIRTDTKFYDQFIYNDFNGIQVPDKPNHGGVYDRLAYGPYEFMKYYCSLYDKIYTGVYNSFAYTGNSESKLLQHLVAGNIPIRTQSHKFYHSVDKDGACME